jgi:Ca2+-binding RTX toxin-like protein
MGASDSNNAISGGSGASTLFANGTSNTLSGGSGNDWIGASGTSNFLFGGSGNCYIAATGSSNTLDPNGSGTDTLFAATAAHDHDTFVYHPGYGNVTIDNFTPQAGDQIAIAGFGFTHVTQLAPYVGTSVDGSIMLNLSSTSHLTLEGIPGGLQDSWFNFHA